MWPSPLSISVLGGAGGWGRGALVAVAGVLVRESATVVRWTEGCAQFEQVFGWREAEGPLVFCVY